MSIDRTDVVPTLEQLAFNMFLPNTGFAIIVIIIIIIVIIIDIRGVIRRITEFLLSRVTVAMGSGCSSTTFMVFGMSSK